VKLLRKMNDGTFSKSGNLAGLLAAEAPTKRLVTCWGS